MRELDWKVHEYMGNDLTGFQYGRIGQSAYKETETGVEWVSIPHYSTTWEGAGLVMEWLSGKNIFHRIKWASSLNEYLADVNGDCAYSVSAPLALCKAYISAMEERNNG